MITYRFSPYEIHVAFDITVDGEIHWDRTAGTVRFIYLDESPSSLNSPKAATRALYYIEAFHETNSILQLAKLQCDTNNEDLLMRNVFSLSDFLVILETFGVSDEDRARALFELDGDRS